ncbi:hypothetical protein EYF80_023520 [Liparis tanakae]|uniref:Uncharacterized protein n=1 Tax=Liparis tanakae TaxID=230148 RepID=A0A4Z2HKJ6_9TELE|nr:hypothetical protein EYF80_023520 [Liparis tanakae]
MMRPRLRSFMVVMTARVGYTLPRIVLTGTYFKTVHFHLIKLSRNGYPGTVHQHINRPQLLLSLRNRRKKATSVAGQRRGPITSDTRQATALKGSGETLGGGGGGVAPGFGNESKLCKVQGDKVAVGETVGGGAEMELEHEGAGVLFGQRDVDPLLKPERFIGVHHLETRSDEEMEKKSLRSPSKELNRNVNLSSTSFS